MTNQRIRRTTPEIDQLAKQLRRNATAAERLLWERLRNRQLDDLKFRRQHPLGHFVADFCCPAHRVIVEVDGPIHRLQAEHDADRTRHFEEFGYQVLRFTNEQIEQDIEEVLAEIAASCAARLHRHDDLVFERDSEVARETSRQVDKGGSALLSPW